MKRVFFCAACLLVALCPALGAQTLGGTWQGTLPTPDHARIAVKLTMAGDGLWHGILYQFDKGPPMGALSSASFAAPGVNFAQINLGVHYEGKMSADGKSLVGTWTQNQQSYPLTLVLATPETLWRRSGPAPPVPMAATADPAFEVATIKPSPPDAKGYSYALRTRDFTAKNRSVLDLIEFAYQVRDRQVSGGPVWMSETKFDLAGEPDAAGQPSVDQYRLMIKKLLASRFHLQLETVQRRFPVYALTRGEKAPKLAHSDPELDSGNIYVKDLPDGQTELHVVGDTMPMLASLLMNMIPERQIVDETGMAGHFEFSLRVATNVMQGGQGSGPGDVADAFRHALQPLGLKLVPKNEPIEVLVVDHVERPSEN